MIFLWEINPNNIGTVSGDLLKKIVITTTLIFMSLLAKAQSVNLHCSAEGNDGWERMTLELSSSQNMALLKQHQTSTSAFVGGTPVTLNQTHEIKFGSDYYADFISNRDSSGSRLLFRVAPIKTNGVLNSSIRVWKSVRKQSEPLELVQDDSAIPFDCVVAN